MRITLRVCLFLGIALLGAFSMYAQNQIPDGDFEGWTPDQLNLYEEPQSEWWATLNPLRNLGGPVSVSKSTDAHSGNYSAHMVSGTYGTLFVPGILLSGSFDILNAPDFFTRGQAYTARPTTFRGWYKFNPANGDSAAVAVQLTRWNSSTEQRDTVGEVGLIIRGSISNWTEFVLPIFYYSNETPDTLVVVATSSADGANFNGQVGSELWIDDFDLDVQTSALEAETDLSVNFAQSEEAWIFQLFEPGTEIRIWDAQGRQVYRSDLPIGTTHCPTGNWPAGIYSVLIQDRKGKSWHEKVLLVK